MVQPAAVINAPREYSWCAIESDSGLGRGKGRLVRRREVEGVDEDEGNPAQRVGTINPGMISAALDQDIPSRYMHFAFIEQHVDLSLQNDGGINALGSMHERVACGRRGGAGSVRQSHFRKESRVIEFAIRVG